jgi:hypothetical protein
MIAGEGSEPAPDGGEGEIPEGGPAALSSVDSLFVVTDGEIGRDSPSLLRHHRLARSLLSAGFARELKPDSEERRRLASLVALPPTTRMREEERELVWKFRCEGDASGWGGEGGIPYTRGPKLPQYVDY